MKRAILLPLILLASCGSPSDQSPVKVIVGAQLDPGHDNPRLEHSVIVIRDGKFQAVGPQQSTPVPKGAQMISGIGKLVTPAPRNKSGNVRSTVSTARACSQRGQTGVASRSVMN